MVSTPSTARCTQPLLNEHRYEYYIIIVHIFDMIDTPGGVAPSIASDNDTMQDASQRVKSVRTFQTHHLVRGTHHDIVEAFWARASQM